MQFDVCHLTKSQPFLGKIYEGFYLLGVLIFMDFWQMGAE